jgi:predicted esterase
VGRGDGAFPRQRWTAGTEGLETGRISQGQDDLPVTGISWYEAAAYAEFGGKSLPTIYHWNRAAGPFSASFIVPASNFSGSGVVPVGSKQDISPWGNYDMAGNVKEWIWTEAESGKRYVLGGGWDEPTYMFIDPDVQSPFLRAANVGFRCVKYIEPESIPKVATDPMPSPRRDLTKEKPASDVLFKAYRSLYSYDKTPLKRVGRGFCSRQRTLERQEDHLHCGLRERTGYRLPAPSQESQAAIPDGHLLSRIECSGATQVLALYDSSFGCHFEERPRAVLYPVYKSTYERGDGMESDVSNETSSWRDHVIMWVKDASRAIDYAETRPELDHNKLAYYGYSWGAEMGAIVPAVDPRIKVCVLALGGLDFHRSLPEVDTINFISRVKQPVLMLNGRYDFFFPLEATQDPFYQLLGSKKDQKKRMLYETGHNNIPRNELNKEILNWLDQYLGPVN